MAMNLNKNKLETIRYCESGLTLVEIAVVSVLLSLLSLIAYGSLTGIGRSKAKIEAEREVTRTAQYVISRLSRELMNRVEQPFASDTNEKESSGTQKKIYFLGKDQKSGSKSSDSIRFSSLGSGQVVFGGEANPGVVEIEYRMVEAKDKDLILTGAEESGEKRMVLVREEIPAGLDSTESAKEIRAKKRIVFPISERVSSLNFRYRRNGKWLDEWSEKRKGFPDAIEITLGIRGAAENTEYYRTAIAIGRD